MVQKITRLPTEVINKIAAGEVVENPASIVKELIENSLDAQAMRIDIAIEGGGTRFLSIEDDGCGMGQEDAVLSLERHATSKIRTEEDLFSLTTMGFRGEALAAISAVCRFEMRTSDGEIGTRILAEGGVIQNIEPCARNRGTSLIVRDLFFNVPARKKFLKSSSANSAALVRALETIALAHPEVSFSLKSDGKLILNLEPQEQKKRIEALIHSMPHEVKTARLWGLFSSPEDAKVHRRGQYLFINQRPIFSPLISKAVKSGYGTMIAESSYPSFVLFLDIAPEEVDVNVHPQKKEVRFSDEAKIFRQVERAVASAFQTPAPCFSRSLSFAPPAFSLNDVPSPSFQKVEVSTQPSFDFAMAVRPLAIVEGYFFVQTEELLLVDLTRAYARVLYESLKNKREAIQSLMWPIEVAIEDENLIKELQEFGIECRLIGKKTLAVDALPSLLNQDSFFDFLNAWREGKKLDGTACFVASKGKKKFNIDEATLLFRQLLQCQESLYDPSGKRIWQKLDKDLLKTILEDA